MRIIFLLLFLGIIMPVFAQESQLNDISNPLENQINQDNLKKLENRLLDLENNVVTKEDIQGLTNQIVWSEYVKDISVNLIATLIGAGVGIYISLKVTSFQKEKNRKTRKSRLVNDIKKELLEIKVHIAEPLKYYQNFKELIYEDEVINGTKFDIDFIGYKLLLQSDTTDFFSYDAIQKIATVELHFQSYAQLEEIRLKFNVEYQHDKDRRINLGNSIIENIHKTRTKIVESVDGALEELKKEE